MATAQITHIGQKHKTLKETALFPSRIASEQESLVLVKRLLAVSISYISYLRGLFPESSCGTCYLEGSHVCCLNSLTEIALEQEWASHLQISLLAALRAVSNVVAQTFLT
ncbi:HORMA domain-containing protein 2-like [Pantherophis guttatus]|uniref:HORMA domain-containing protein 2-like n=1 Tax=Pantherophis guttatus TaxID=94885 RepID=A0ABM3YYC8_PANGU|nr:HORMA domain-containing protein 2-like [Pantherophis guttatus]